MTWPCKHLSAGDMPRKIFGAGELPVEEASSWIKELDPGLGLEELSLKNLGMKHLGFVWLWMNKIGHRDLQLPPGHHHLVLRDALAVSFCVWGKSQL